ncbi:MAG: SPFH domain-containing protein, partial [Lutimonas sp.]
MFSVLPFSIVIIILLIFFAAFIVKQQTAVIIERFGKFQSVRTAGLQFKIPLIDRIAAKVSLKIQQLDVIIETKTKDDVFVHLKISVQYQILKNKVYEAFYELQNPKEQITAYVFD